MQRRERVKNRSTLMTIKWGILGCGHIALKFLSGIKPSEKGSVVACAARSYEKAKLFAKTHKIDQAVETYEQLATSADIDAIYVANTHNAHFETVKLCLSAGKHVLCEKPLTVNAAQTKVLVDLASKNNVLLMEAVWTRFLPAIRSLQTAIQDGIIGDIVTVKADFSLNRELPVTHRLRNPELAGGALLDLGIYPLTIASIVFETAPHAIYAQCVLDDETRVDQRGFYTIDFGQGKTALLTSGYTQDAPCEAVISGTKGHIIVPHFLGAKSYQIFMQDEAPTTVEMPYEEGHEFCAEIEHFHECLAKGLTQSPILPPSKTLEMMQTMDEIRRQWGLEYSEELERVTVK